MAAKYNEYLNGTIMTVDKITLDEITDSNWEVIMANDIPGYISDDIAGPSTKVMQEDIASKSFRKSVPKNAVPKSVTSRLGGNSAKGQKVPFSFRRTKTTKEIIQDQKQAWENEKLEKKAKLRMDQIRFVEERKQKRHEERCKVVKGLSDKM